MKLSIVVPVYNIENYIKECVDSILNQTYKNFELILVDDGSTDNSGKICDEYKKDKRVKVIHKENGGLSSTRNIGIKNALGDYIMFIDGDDFLSNKNAIKNIIEKIKSDDDIIQYNMSLFYNDSKKTINYKALRFIENGEIIDSLEKLNLTNQVSVSACDKIIRLKLIKDNDLYFDEKLLSEDIDSSLNLYLYANKISVINEYAYMYRQQRKGSITNKTSSKNMTDLLYIVNKWFNYSYDDDRLKNIYLNYIAYQYLILITKSENSMFNKKELEQIDLIGKTIFNYSKSKKVKIAKIFKKIFGLKVTIGLMRFYLKLKNKGLLRI